ncbi:MAG: hydroxyisourate hydrolase [Synechococcales bacterium]|nr:hydroxyisourate hydrolase [Cyanobacteria bacterium REEB444]MEB3126137.1 hydroxyisourate hydrolase [Synechococcales bacterium]
MSGKLTTHVLDTTRGQPAPAIPIEVWFIDSPTRLTTLLKSICTNSDGRAVLLTDRDFKAGEYELIFEVGPYWRDFYPVDTMPFLNRIPIRFGIPEPNGSYHIPLLVSPWAYSTYRGS